ncbi:MAG: hypothetical protein AABX47_08995 [Nanoarchaeota archaeon]
MARRYSPVQWLSIALMAIVIVSFIGFLIGYVDPLAFWVILGVVAFLAYKKIPGWVDR